MERTTSRPTVIGTGLPPKGALMSGSSIQHRSITRCVTALSATVVAAGILAAGALADHPNDRSGALGPGAIAATQAVAVRTDDRAGLRGPGAISPTPARAAALHVDDRAGARGPGAFSPAQVALPTITSPNSFHWSDASVGAASALGLVALAGVLLLTIRHRSQPVAS
jgi:hypothetical protein